MKCIPLKFIAKIELFHSNVIYKCLFLIYNNFRIFLVQTQSHLGQTERLKKEGESKASDWFSNPSIRIFTHTSVAITEEKVLRYRLNRRNRESELAWHRLLEVVLRNARNDCALTCNRLFFAHHQDHFSSCFDLVDRRLLLNLNSSAGLHSPHHEYYFLDSIRSW